MKKVKIILSVLLTFFILCMAGLFYLRAYFTQERIKALILPVLEKKLKGTISINNFDFSLFRGIELGGIKVQTGGKGGVSSFQCEQAFLRPRLFPLLFGKLVMSQVSLIRPQFFIIGKVEGIAALPAVLKGEAGKEKEPSGEKTEKMDLTIERLKIEQGDLVLINPEGSRLMPPILQLEEINLSASQLSLSSSIPFSFSGRLKGIESEPLKIEGLITPRKKGGEVNISWDKVQVTSINQAIHSAHPFLSQGEVDLAFHLSIREESPLVAEGRLRLANGRLTHPEPAQGRKKIRDDKVEAEGTYQLTWEQGKALEGKVGKGKVVYHGVTLKDLGGNFSWKEKTLNLTGVKGKMGEGVIQAKGDIGFAKEEQDFSIEVKGDRIPIDQCLSLSASNARRDITGNLSGEVKLNGIWEKKGINKEQLQGNGRISLSQGKIAGVKVLEQASTILGYEGLSPLTVSEGKMDFQVGEGKVKTDGWLKAPDLEVSSKGNVRLDSTLNLLMELRCAPRIFSRFNGRAVVDLLKDERGWIVVPLKVKGTWDDPSVRLHSSEFKKKMKDTLHQLYEGFIEKGN